MPLIEPRPILRVAGMLLAGLSAAMLVPAAVDASVGNRDWQPFLGSAAFTAFFAGAFVASSASRQPIRLNLRQAFLLTAVCWIAFTAFAAVPFLAVGHGYTDAFFEAISGVTTTGSTVLTGLDTLPPGILLWRSILQWVGGVGIIVMAIAVLPVLRIGGMQLFRTESSERSESVVPGAFKLAAWITAIYVLLTLACAIAYGLTGMSAFDAVAHAMTTLSTGGYSTHDASFSYFTNDSTHWVGVVFMVAGAFPFVAYIKTIKGDRRALWHDPQVRGLVALLVVSAVVMALWLSAIRDMGFVAALRLSAFNITSVVTTTGYASDDYSAWGNPAVGAFLILMFVGGCAGSTAGGIKIYRLQVLWYSIRAQLLQMISPRRVTIMSYGSRRLTSEVFASVLAFVAVFMLTVAAFTIALAALGLDLVTALSASVTAICNVGPGLGTIIGPVGNFANLPDAVKWLLSAAMLLGRLEIFTILVLLDPEFWRG